MLHDIHVCVMPNESANRISANGQGHPTDLFLKISVLIESPAG